MELIPIQNIEAEQSVIGSIINNSKLLHDTFDFLDPEDFYQTNNQILYREIVELFKKNPNIDIVSLSDSLTAKKLLKDAGGRSYITSCSNFSVSSVNFKKHCEIIKDKSLRRKLLNAQEENKTVIYDEDKEIKTVLSEAQSRIFKIDYLKKQDDSSGTAIRELLETQEEYDKKYKAGEKYIGYQCGFKNIDDVIDGIRPGHVWVVGAFTSTGKTQFALNIVHSLLEQEVPTAIISLEMSKVDTVARLIGIRHDISAMRVIKGINEKEIADNIEEGKWFIGRSPLLIHTTFFDLEKIKMLIRRDFYTKGVKVFVIDYIQNIISDKAKKEYELLTQAAVDLQSLARELAISVYIVSQISNEAERGQSAGAGFKGSGALEAVADFAIRLKRNKGQEDINSDSVPVDIVITKNRHGFTGIISDYNMNLKSGKFVKKYEKSKPPPKKEEDKLDNINF